MPKDGGLPDMAFPGGMAAEGAPSPVVDAGRFDTMLTAVVALVYSAALSVQAVTMPLLAISSHYSKPEVGILTALSAVTQLAFRLGAAAALRRVADRHVVIAATVVLALSGLMLTWSTGLTVFASAELVQGAARGMFWTAAQSHVVRSRTMAVSRLATVNFVSSFGLLMGPPLAGFLIERSFAASLDVAAGLGLLAGVLAAVGMHRLPPFGVSSRRTRSRLWDRPGVRSGCWAGVTAGSWRGLVNSYLPLVLQEAGDSSVVLGVMVAVANGASIAGPGLLRVLGQRAERAQRWLLPVSTVATGIGIGASGLAASRTGLEVALLALSGLGAGMLQTLGPAVAAMGVDRSRRGDAIAIAGSFRAGALFAAPIGTAGLLDAVSLPPALVVAGVLLALPASIAWTNARR